MKRKLKKILWSAGTTLLLCIVILVGAILNPSFLYAKYTQFENVHIYHNQELPNGNNIVISGSLKIVKQSELFHENISINLCLNDGPVYPKIIEKIKGLGWAYTVGKNISLNCRADFKNNLAHWNLNKYQGQNRKWNLTELIAHEMVHACQSHNDFWTAEKYAFWKVEGYAEYIARSQRLSLRESIALLQEADINGLQGWDMHDFPDGTGILYNYLNFSTVVRYLIEVKNLSYQDLLHLNTPFESLKKDMLAWAEQGFQNK